MAATTAGGGRGDPADDPTGKTDVHHAVAALGAQVKSLQSQLQRLERENQMLRTRMSRCSRCSKFGVTTGGTLQEGCESDEFGVDEAAEAFREFSSMKGVIDPAKENDSLDEPDKCIKHGLTEGLRGSMVLLQKHKRSQLSSLKFSRHLKRQSYQLVTKQVYAIQDVVGQTREFPPPVRD